MENFILRKLNQRRIQIKTKQYTGLIAKLDRLFSKYIRLKYSDNGVIRCYTCDKPYVYNNIQCGHFVSRKYWNYRFHEDNARPQCIKCNYFEHGNYAVYARKLAEEIGHEKVQYMQANKSMKKLYQYEIEALIKHYTKKLKELENDNKF